LKLIICFLLLSFGNCLPLYQRTNGPTHGLLFTQNKFPGEFNQNNDISPTKRAEGCLHHFFFIAMWGDAGAGSIAMKNNIKKIATIDHSTLSVMGLYLNYCTIIRGE
jgi:hypothetical protein